MSNQSPRTRTEIADPARLKRAKKCHAILEKCALASLACGKTLREIRDDGLFRELGFKSFELYLKERSPYGKSQSYALIEAFGQYERLEAIEAEFPIVKQFCAVQTLQAIGKVPKEKVPNVLKLLTDQRAEVTKKSVTAVVKTIIEPKSKSKRKGEKVDSNTESDSAQSSGQNRPDSGQKPPEEGEGKKERPAPANALMPEGYSDDAGREVPEHLWPVWRKIKEFGELVEFARELSGRTAQLGKDLGIEDLDPLAALLRDVSERIHDQTPSVVIDDGWLSRLEAMQ